MSLGALAGFLSMLPGGALARELASIWILLSIVPEPIALIATVVVRITSIIAELSMIALSKSNGLRVDRNDASDGQQGPGKPVLGLEDFSLRHYRLGVHPSVLLGSELRIFEDSW
jgi:hypothetical protein